MATGNNGNVEVRENGGFKSLFALKNFHQGQEVISLPITTQPTPDKYSIEIMPGIHLDCSRSLAGAINHSCEPNSAVRNGRIVAWSCINEGDQITIDYKRTEEKLASPFDCVCGSKNCRGRIE